MPRAEANGIELEYEAFGDDGAPAVFLISGWGSQLISWHDSFCDELVRRGFRAIRFDNRDVGLSSKIDARPERPSERDDGSTYALEDMADDTVGLMDALGVDKAHVMGASMGGMIAQVIAIRHPNRVLSLTSIMSTTGARDVGGASDEAKARLALPAPATREERVQSSIDSCRVNWGDSEEFPFDEELARWRAEVSEDRCLYPEGRIRQALAMRATGDRTTALRQLRVPTLVIHGDNDGLVHVSGGEATAAAIPDAELMIIRGMGHVVDRRATDRILDAFERLVARVAVA
ncbi:MAG TPA: alpha/beta hydrolase [Acidimicrobiales bacterium]|nr:alpha/beta hydrolase [Acidimicrobiales bacterium]